MGAVSVLLYLNKYFTDNNSAITKYSVQGIILDSPFTNFEEMIIDIAQRAKGVPRFVTKSAIFFVRGEIEKSTGHDIFGIEVTEAAKKLDRIPAYFMVSEEDVLTPLAQVNKLYEMYACGHKKLKKLTGHHHTQRTNNEIFDASQFVIKLANSRK